ncbi:MAG: glycosyltransferase family 2 protein [Acidimicrobiia bacterium]
MDLTVVMPAHDEADYLEDSVNEIVEGLRKRHRSFTVLIVENGSSDGTPDIARALAQSVPEVGTTSLPAADYGAALRHGLLEAKSPLVVTFDVDYFSLTFLDDALTRLDTEPDLAVVVASKRSPDADDRRPWTRRAVTAGFSAILRVGFGLETTDTHGMKALRRQAVEPLARACASGADLFDTELVIRTERSGLGVSALGVTVEERRPSRTPVLTRVPRTLVGLARLRHRLGGPRHAGGTGTGGYRGRP